MAKAFAGRQTPAEEKAEARLVRSGKVSPSQYASREKAEGDSKPRAALLARGKQLAKGEVSPESYASAAMPKMANGGYVSAYADGGYVLSRQVVGAPNTCDYNKGPGVRSFQDYKK